MLRKTIIIFVLLISAFIFYSCSAVPEPVSVGIGTNPKLPEPETKLLPTINIATAQSWPPGTQPIAADGLTVQEFANKLDHPRWIYVLPNGDVLVAESNSPKGLALKGIKGFIAKRVQKKAGAGTEIRSIFLENLYSPFGMSLIDNTLYIANADAIVSLPYISGELKASSEPKEFFPLPAGINHHWTKNIIASKDGSKIYASVGSNSNIGENGMDIEEGRAAIWEIDVATGQGQVFASGIRNPVGMDFGPDENTLFTVVNERDELGDNLVPDYLTSVKKGGFYGWPYSYFGSIVDERVKPQEPDQNIGMKSHYGAGAFIGQHGSWNRKPRSGYKVIFVPFVNAMPKGEAIDVLTGFLQGDIARGRPVGVAFDNAGALLVADDVGNNIWRVLHLITTNNPQRTHPNISIPS